MGMNNTERYFLAEDPTEEGSPQFVVEPRRGWCWRVVISTDFNDMIRPGDGTIAAYRNPDSIVEWIQLVSVSDHIDNSKADAALNWYLGYLRWEDNGEPVLFKPWRDDMPDVFVFQNKEGTAYALLHNGIINTASSMPLLFERIVAIHPGRAEYLPGHSNLIEWPAN